MHTLVRKTPAGPDRIVRRPGTRRPPTLKELPPGERPRERLLCLGEERLTDAELLGILFGSGLRGATAVDLGRTLLARFGDLHGLAVRSVAELTKSAGIGLARAARLRAGIELGRRLAAMPIVRGEPLTGPRDVERRYGPLLRGLRRERFYVVHLDGRNRVLHEEMVAEGTATEAQVYPREAFASAIRESAAAILAVHNHPSGDPAPSKDDVRLTHRLALCGDLLGIPLLDHVIVAGGRHVSLAEVAPWKGKLDLALARGPAP